MTANSTYHGIELTDEVVEQIADNTLEQLDRLDPEIMIKRARLGRPLLGSAPTKVMPIRVEPAMRHEIAARARADRISQSEVVRRALSAYLAPHKKRAPGGRATLKDPKAVTQGKKTSRATTKKKSKAAAAVLRGVERMTV